MGLEVDGQSSLMDFFKICGRCIFKIEVQLIYNVLLISAVQKMIQLYIYTCIPFHTLFHCGLSQDIEYSSRCYNEGLVTYPPYLIVYVWVP